MIPSSCRSVAEETLYWQFHPENSDDFDTITTPPVIPPPSQQQIFPTTLNLSSLIPQGIPSANPLSWIPPGVFRGCSLTRYISTAFIGVNQTRVSRLCPLLAHMPLLLGAALLPFPDEQIGSVWILKSCSQTMWHSWPSWKKWSRGVYPIKVVVAGHCRLFHLGSMLRGSLYQGQIHPKSYGLFILHLVRAHSIQSAVCQQQATSLPLPWYKIDASLATVFCMAHGGLCPLLGMWSWPRTVWPCPVTSNFGPPKVPQGWSYNMRPIQ